MLEFGGRLSQTSVDTETFGDFAELFISRPQKGGRIDIYRRYQVCVDEADPPVVQVSSFDREPHFVQLRHPHLR